MTSTAALPQIPALLGSQILSLAHEALAHEAVRHPFLAAFAGGRLGDPIEAVRRYAWEYSGYSAWFPHYLRSVIDRLAREDHRALLLHNLEEERGQLGADDCAALREVGIAPEPLIGVPHPVLFRRFCSAVHVTELELSQPSPAAVHWRTRFLAFLQNATEAEAVGALGLGTELVVKPIYHQLLAGIRRAASLRREDYVFFELHCLVDDQHQLDLLAIARDLSASATGLGELRRGMLTALELRREFWNALELGIRNQPVLREASIA